MVGSVDNNISALNALSQKMNVISNNVANSQTEEFKKSRADLQEGPDGNVEAKIQEVNTPGPVVSKVENGEMVEKEMSNVDVAEELTQTIPTQRGYEANITMVKTRDEMLGTVMDIIG